MNDKELEEYNKKMNTLNNHLNIINTNEGKLKELIVDLKEELEKSFIIDDKIICNEEIILNINKIDEMINN